MVETTEKQEALQTEDGITTMAQDATRPEGELTTDNLVNMSHEQLLKIASGAIDQKREANAEAKNYREQRQKVSAELTKLRADQEKAKKEAELAQMSEKERLESEKADLSRELEDERKLNNEVIIDAEAVRIAAQLGFHDPGDASRLLDKPAIMVGGTVDRELITEQIKALAEEKPWYIKTDTKEKARTTPLGPTNTSSEKAPSARLNINAGTGIPEAARDAQKLFAAEKVTEGVRSLNYAWERNEKARSGKMYGPAPNEEDRGG